MSSTTGTRRIVEAFRFRARLKASVRQFRWWLLALAFITNAAHAQHPAPYAGKEQRAIKALSDDEVKQYSAGAGMGHAKAAELNRYPGPMHVLELADTLELSSEQRTKTAQLMDAA